MCTFPVVGDKLNALLLCLENFKMNCHFAILNLISVVFEEIGFNFLYMVFLCALKIKL